MSVQSPQLLANDSVVFAELDQEAVLLNVESGVYFGLDEIGTEIWNLLSAGTSEDEIVNRLAAEYDVELAQVRADVREFIGELESHALVHAAACDAPR